MSRAALILMIATWTVILLVTGWLFIKVLRTPQRDDEP